MKIAVVIGSTRKGRKGDQVGHWIARHAAGHPTSERLGADFAIVDLADHNLDFYDDSVQPSQANRQYSNPATRAWSAVIDAFDAFIFVTPEYNHSVPAPMKNAFDMLYPEWKHKAIAFAAYGPGGGQRAVEHWRAIVSNAYMLGTRSQLSVFLRSDFVNDVFAPHPQLETNLHGLIDELLHLTRASQSLRVEA